METAAGRRRSTRRATAPAAAEGKIERLDERPPVAARDSGVIARVGPARCLQSGGAVDSREVDGVQGEISYRSLPRAIPGCEGGRGSAALAAGPMTAGLVGSGRVRRHPHRRARSAPQCGVSRGPRACRVRVPILADRSPAAPWRIDRLFGANRRNRAIRRPPPSVPWPRRYSGIPREGSGDTCRCIALSGRCGATTGHTR